MILKALPKEIQKARKAKMAMETEKAKLEKAKMEKEKTRATTLPKQRKAASMDSIAGSITGC